MPRHAAEWGLEAQPGATLDGYGYLQREMPDTLDTWARAKILRLRAMAENGVLESEWGDARAVQVAHGATRTVTCHRADTDGRVDAMQLCHPSDLPGLH